MKYCLFICTLLLSLGCSTSPEVSKSKEILIKEKIQNNITQAQKAQAAYIKLQKRRAQE